MKYIFRGIEVFNYDPVTKEMTIPKNKDFTTINNFNYCNFIPEDFMLIASFFLMAHGHATGTVTTEELENIEVG